MQRAYVDTNVLLRFITGTPPEDAEQVKRLFEAVDRGDIQLILDEIVVAEAVWVLTSFYKFPRQEVRSVLQALIVHEGIIMEHKTDVLVALAFFAELNVDFEDALLAVHMGQSGTSSIVTFDRHFKRLPGVRPIPPNALF